MSTSLPAERRVEVRDICQRLTTWAHQRDDIRALAMVGSWARGTPRADSDLDLVILTDAPTLYTESEDWLEVLDRPPLIRAERFGVLSERRVRLPSGLEIEFGIVSPAWASIDPLDPGTERVARDGLIALHDPEALLARLRTAVTACG